MKAEIKTAQREVSCLTEVQKGIMRDTFERKNKYKKVSIGGALEAAKQRLAALSAKLRRYIRDAEAKTINGLFAIY